MNRNSLQEKTNVAQALIPLSRVEATYLSSAIDSQSVALCEQGLGVLLLGAETGTPTSHSTVFKLTHCDTSGGTYTDVTGATTTITTLPGASGSRHEVKFSPAACKRYRKWSLAIDFTGGSTPAFPCAAIEIIGGCQFEPLS